MTIGKKLISGCVVSLVVALALGYSSISAVENLSSELDKAINLTAQKVVQAGEIRTAVEKMAALQRGVLADQMMKKMQDIDQFKLQFRESVATVRHTLAELKPTLETEQGRQAVDLMTAALEKWNDSFDEMEKLCDSGKFESADAIRVETSRPLYRQMQSGTKLLADAANGLLQQAASEAKVLQQFRNGLAWSLMVVAVLVGGALLFAVWQSLRELRAVASSMVASSLQVAESAGQVASGSQSLAQGASEQAASLEETSASTEEINSMVRANAESSRQAAGTVNQSGQKFEAANRLLREMVTAMQGVNSSSEKISRIIKVIEEIAFQTNILALNAAVEAARAGEAGMGFAVVADEVRNLAQRCSQAAKDTSQLIEESITMSKGGTAKVESVASAIAQVTGDASAVARLVDEIHAGSEQQSSGIEQIARAVQHMESVTQSTAAAAERSARAAEELHAQARAFSEQAARLESVVGRADSEPSTSART